MAARVLRIESLGRFVEAIVRLRDESAEHGVWWFRGHSRREERLSPRVMRADFTRRARHLPENSSNGDESEALEKQLNDRFRRQGASLLPTDCDPVEMYFLAQHHGVPTRLLDWTANPLAALFFAAVERTEEDGEVVAAFPDWRLTFGKSRVGRRRLPLPPLNQRHELVVRTIDYLFDLGPRPEEALILPVHPDWRRARMLQQGSCFTLHMPDSPPINEEAAVRRFVVPGIHKAHLLTALRAVQVSWSTLFPDLDHLAKDIWPKTHGHDEPRRTGADRQNALDVNDASFKS